MSGGTLPPFKWAGYRASTRARSTGTVVVVVDGRAQGLDTEGGRWSTICDDHDWIVAHETLKQAVGFMRHPEEWCEPCMLKVGA